LSTHHRSFLLALLLPAFLLGSVFAVVHAKDEKSPAARQTRWSDPATWPDKKVPRAGDKVTIAAGKDVVLDVTPPALGGVNIEGKLSFANARDL
jgi:hypothetical protein